MLRFRRPDKPVGFEDRARPARAEVESAVAAGRKPSFEPAIWRAYKSHFAKAQHSKCAYCDKVVTSWSAIDHFRPKSAVTELDDDPASWGREQDGLTTVEGRRPRTVSDLGYWWLVSEWDNFRFACELCNSTWKGSLFPIAGERSGPPRPDVEEEPLLLDPYGEENPSAHLRFTELGSVEPEDGSRRGFETIRSLGLDRGSLVTARAPIARNAFLLVTSLRAAAGEAIDKIIEDILRMGSAKFEHAGMFRIIVEQGTGLKWQELEAVLDE